MKIVVIDKELSDILARMSFCGAMLIVALHTHVSTFSHEVSRYILALIGYSQFLNMAVPMFFAISGFLLVGRCNQPGWWMQAMKKRVKTLVIPFFVWLYLLSAVRLLVCAICPEVSGENTVVGLTGVSRIAYLLGCDFIHCNGIVWYIRSLLLFISLAPCFVWVFKRGNRTVCYAILFVLFIFSFLYDTTNLFSGGFYAYFFNPNGLFAFAVGMAIRLSCLRTRVGKWIYSAWAGVFFLCLVCRSTCAGPLFAYFLKVIDMLVLFDLCRYLSCANSVRGYAFSIYLIHYVFIDLMTCLSCSCRIGTGFWGDDLLYPIRIIGVVIASIVATRIINRNRRLADFVFGGRCLASANSYVRGDVKCSHAKYEQGS